MMKRKDLTSHILEAASSHYVLQLSEIKRLRRIIHNVSILCCGRFLCKVVTENHDEKRDHFGIKIYRAFSLT